MATHSGILAWKIPWTEESGGLQSMGSQRVGHDSADTHTHKEESTKGFLYQYKNFKNYFSSLFLIFITY